MSTKEGPRLAEAMRRGQLLAAPTCKLYTEMGGQQVARPKQTQIAIMRGCHNEKGSGHCETDLSMSNQLAGEQKKFEPDRHLFCLVKVPHGLWLHQGWVLDVCIR